MRLGVSQGLSQELTDRLHHTFLHHRNLIERVYLFDISFNSGPLQPALGIRMPDAVLSMWEDALWPNLEAVLHEMLERRSVLNVFLLNQAGSLEKHVKDFTLPIYENAPETFRPEQ